MAQIPGAFPYDLDGLLGGRARVLYAPDSQAIPVNIADVVDMTDPYPVNADWLDLGATRESASYSREIASSGYEIQQATGMVIEEITDVSRTMGVSIAEINPAHLQIIEEAAAVGTVAAAVGKSAQKQVKFGSFSDLTHYRMAFIAQRSRASGQVIEPAPGSKVRGRFVMLCLYNVTIAADSSEFEFDKGTLVHAPLTLTAFPEAGQDAGEEFGTWLTEDAGTIA
jgi:hypothetical protein